MDVSLQRHFAKFIYVIPDGLREISSDICREVIRSQPIDLYTFIADYLDALLLTRENARVASRLIQDIVQISQTTAEILEKTGMSREAANKAAIVIQRRFKEYIEEKGPPNKRRVGPSGKVEVPKEPELVVSEIIEEAEIDREYTENAALIIQKAFRIFLQKKERERKLFTGMIDWREAARKAISLFRRTGPTTHEGHKAAALIKASYKGYYERKYMKKIVDEVKAGPSTERICETYSVEFPTVKPKSVECTICNSDYSYTTSTETEDRFKGICLCQYTDSEKAKIIAGEMSLPESIHEPPPCDDDEIDDENCYCKLGSNEIDRERMTDEPLEEIQEDDIQVKYVRLLYEDQDEENNYNDDNN